MNSRKSENQLAFEIQIKEVLQKAHAVFEQNDYVKAQLDSLDPKVADASGITFEQYRHHTMLELFSKQARSLNKDGIDYAIEMILPPSQADALKELRIQILSEMIQ